MAEIDVQRKSNSWIWWVIGLIILALLVWWIIPGDDDADIAVTPVPIEGPATAEPPPPEPIAQGPLSLADLLGNPAGYIGQLVTLESDAVEVTEVPSDRGFWVEDGGARVFVIINEPPPADANEAQRNEPLNIEPGQTVRITEAVAQDPTFITSLMGEISPETMEILETVPVYLVTDWGNIEMVGGQ